MFSQFLNTFLESSFTQFSNHNQIVEPNPTLTIGIQLITDCVHKIYEFYSLFIGYITVKNADHKLLINVMCVVINT